MFLSRQVVVPAQDEQIEMPLTLSVLLGLISHAPTLLPQTFKASWLRVLTFGKNRSSNLSAFSLGLT